ASRTPLTRSSIPKLARTWSRTNEYSSTSIASSIHPSAAAISARRASGLACSMRQGANVDARSLQDRTDVTGEGRGARRVAVQADGVGIDGDDGPVDGHHAAL